MAAPHVAGAAAILLSGGFTPAEAVEQLLRTAVDLGEPGADSVYGAGLLDIAAALATPPPTLAPPAPASPPAAVATAAPAAPARSVPPAATPPAPAPAPEPRRVPPRPFSFGRIQLPDWETDGLPVWLIALAAAAVVADGAGVFIGLRRRRGEGRRAVKPA
jgi:hypothetical protein